MSLFERTALALHANGFSLLPIGAGTKSPGTYRGFITPDGDGPWFGLKDWQNFCTERADAHKTAAWGRMATAKGGGLGIACGYGGLVAVDIDDDSLIQPLCEVLPPIMVAKRGRKGLTAFYRATESLPSKNYRAVDKRGLIDFLAAGKQTVLPPSIHPNTGRPYEWTTARTLLDTLIADLPEFTEAHRVAMEEVLRQHGWEPPTRAEPCAEHAEPIEQQAPPIDGRASYDDFNRAVNAARSRWLPLLGLHRLRRVSGGWRAVASFRASGSGKPTHKRDLNLSIRDAGEIIDHGTNEGYNNITLVAACLFPNNNAAAFVWLRETLGLTAEPPISPTRSVEPTYPDRRVSLAEAEAAIASLVRDFYVYTVPAARHARAMHALKPRLIIPEMPVVVAKVEAGLGKSRETALGTARQKHLAGVYAVARYNKADEVETDLRMLGVNALTYRTFDRDDPEQPGKKMCQNLAAYRAARDIGVGVHSAVCERREGMNLVRCPFANQCGMMRQRDANPDFWIVTSAKLFHARPDCIFSGRDQPLGALIIDEAFHNSAFGDPVTIDMEALIRAKIEGCNHEEAESLGDHRIRLYEAIKTSDNGYLTRASLINQGIDALEAGWVACLELRRMSHKVLRPDMPAHELAATVRRHKDSYRLARDAFTFWEEIGRFLLEGVKHSGRISVSGTEVTVRPLRTIHRDWDAPTLVLDATAPPTHVLATIMEKINVAGLPSAFSTKPEVTAHWSPHVYVRRVLNAPASMTKVGLGRKPKPANRKALLRYIKLRAALASPATIGVITYKGVLEDEDFGGHLPNNVIVHHFGALSGMNDMKDVAGLIVIGRIYPPPSSIEAQAEVLSGAPVPPVGDFYPRCPGGIRLADDRTCAVDIDRHPDPTAEACRWQSSDADLIQAVYRLRPHRRAGAAWLDILSDVPLPIVEHEVVEWKDVAPGAEADMASEGLVLTNSRDAMAVYGLSKHDAERTRGCPEISIRDSIEKSGQPPPVRRVCYRKSGAGQKVNEAIYLPGVLPGGMPALREKLESKLGPLATLEVERVTAADSGTAQAMFARIGKASVAWVTGINRNAREIAETNEPNGS